MNNKTIILLFLVVFIISGHAKKTRGRSSSSGRGSSSRTKYNPQPAPTSLSNPQASAPKPTLFGWQEKPVRNTQTYSKPSSGQSHSYPSSQTGLSGNSPAKQPPTYQESVQKSSIPQQTAQRPATQTNNQPSHSYPSSNGLSGNSGSGGYPQGTGLSGSGPVPARGSGAGYPLGNGATNTGVGYPQGSGVAGAGGLPPPYSGYKPGTSNAGNYPAHGVGNSHYPQQGPPPPYSNYGGYGGHNSYNPGYSPQMPGYFGNYGGNGGGFGGVSRSGNALKGIGIAGAGVGTILTGLALWNLARSTGHNHHTVVYDNRGQPVAVAPANGTDPVVDSILNDLVNCTLTVSSVNATEVIAIPCAIATSFTPEADVQDVNSGDNKSDNTRCTVTVVKKTGKEFMTTIPCSILLNTAAENNVTEPPVLENSSENFNSTLITSNDTPNLNQPSPLILSGDNKNVTEHIEPEKLCSTALENGEVRDPINPCLAITHNLTVIPLDNISESPAT